MRSVLMIVLVGLSVNCANADKAVPRIAILQDKPQEWADALKLGFSDGLAENGVEVGKEVILVPRSSGGDPQAMATLIETFAKDDYVAIYTLGTQVTQDLLARTATKAIIFGAVTDPVAAGLYTTDLQHPKGNITGSQDLWPYPAQFDLMRKLLPNLHKIGVMYNSSEINSQVSVGIIQREAKLRGIEVVVRNAATDAEIPLATAALLASGVDALFIPADNTAQASAASIIATASLKRIPVFTGISGIVETGALATVGTNYYELGKVNAKQAVQILSGKAASTVAVAVADKGDIYINLKTAKQLGVGIPDSIRKIAVKIYE